MIRLVGSVRSCQASVAALRCSVLRQHPHLASSSLAIRNLSSKSSSTWNWNTLSAAETNNEKLEEKIETSQESQVMKKTAELYMSLMPLNQKVCYATRY